jgi:hypothetical protein
MRLRFRILGRRLSVAKTKARSRPESKAQGIAK